MSSPDSHSDYPATSQAHDDHNSTTLGQRCSSCQMALPAGARFCLNCGQPVGERTSTDEAHLIHLAAAAPRPLVEKVRAAAGLTGERRQVTALFVDIVGSGALSEQVGPTNWSTIMDRTCDWFCSVIYRYEGTIARFVGDELLAFFGAPVAHEDDPVRAVRAALDILDTVHQQAMALRREFAVDFGVRISLSTGPVTIGPISSDLQFDYSALEGTLNLAARLEATKQPMAALVSEETYRLVAPFFTFVDLGKMDAGNQGGAIHIYQVIEAKEHRHQTRRLAGLESPMVGRDAELASLVHLAETVAAGLGRVVLIMGESGVGKTRLVTEWTTAMAQADYRPPLRWAKGHGLSHGRELAYYLVCDLLRSLIGVPGSASEPETRAALSTLCTRLFGDVALDVYPYLGRLLSLELEGPALERAQALDPQALQAQYVAAFKRLLLALAARGPVVLILEDLQWADPSSIEILRLLLPLAATAPLLFCLVTRLHASAPGWQLITAGREIMGRRCSEWTLKSLDEDDSWTLVSNLLQLESLPPRLQRFIFKKAEGNPLFIEEILRMMIDRGTIRPEKGSWIVETKIEMTGIPDTLQGLLLARLDRLSEEARHTLRVAAVIGRHFPVRVLENVLGKDQDGMGLINHLGDLETSGLIELFQVKPELAYRFRHTLLQDVAYASLLAADRQRLHLAVGTAMEELYAENLEPSARQLAHHFSMAGDNQSALRYFSLAGDVALNACANQEAASRYRRALDLAPAPSEQAALLYKLGEALYWQSRFQDAIRIWRDGIRLYQDLGSSENVARLYARSVRALWDAGDTPGGLSLCQQGLAAVSGATEDPGLALLLHEAARAHLFNGLAAEARPLCEQALAMAKRLGETTVQAEALATLGLLPDQPPEEALALLCSAADLAESAGLLSQAARAHINLAALRVTKLLDFEAACDHYQRAAALQRLRGNTAGELLGLAGKVGVLLEMGDFDAVDATLPVMRQLSAELTDPGPAAFHIRISEALLKRYRGKLAEAAAMLRTLQVEERSRGNLRNLVDVDCHLAEIVLAARTSFEPAEVAAWSEAEAALVEAIEICDRWSTGEMRPRCLLSMVYACQEQLVEARQLLSAAQEKAGAHLVALDEGWLPLATARLAAAEGRSPEALAAFETAAGTFARLGMRWWRARILPDWAEIHIARGEPTDLEQARALLQRASSLFTELGIPVYVKLVEDSLQALIAESYAQALDHQQVVQEMAEARKIQAGLLPVEPPRIPGWQLAAALVPSRQTSGDFYDFIPLPNGRLGLVIADVTDKGASAALFMALSRSLIRTCAADHETHPERVLAATNRRILTDTHTGLFVTVFYAILDPETGTLHYSNAGHNPPYLFHGDQDGALPLTRTGIPVGIVDDLAWERRTTQLAPGDVLILYTDGVTEAQDGQGAPFRAQRLLATVQSHLGRSAQEIQNAVLSAVHQFAGGTPQFDDITLIVLVRESA